MRYFLFDNCHFVISYTFVISFSDYLRILLHFRKSYTTSWPKMIMTWRILYFVVLTTILSKIFSTKRQPQQSLFPHLLGMMSCNDQFQEMYAGLLGDPMTNGPQLPTRILASLSAGFTAALFSMPFDLIKSRLMAQRPDPLTGEMPYKGVMDCVMKMMKTEGPMGFYNGFSAYYGRCAPHAMIVLLSKDSITKAYRNAFE